MTNETKTESSLCDFCERKTNGTHHSILMTGDRHEVEICGECYGKAIRQLAEAGHVDFDDEVGFPKPEVEVYGRELDRRDDREYDGLLTDI